MDQPIRVGVFNWTEFSRQGSYYPEDIPREWRLAYFANEFETACIDLSCCQSDPSSLIEWTDDLQGSFELSLYLSTTVQFDILREYAEQISRPIHYLVFDHTNRDLLDQLSGQQEFLQHSTVIKNVVPFDALWTPLQRETSTIALLPAQGVLRHYREWIEQWLSLQTRQQPLTLWLQGDEATDALLMEIRTLVELMGH